MTLSDSIMMMTMPDNYLVNNRGLLNGMVFSIQPVYLPRR